MQCNTNYTGIPENYRFLNLNVLKLYAKTYPDLVLGLSDHTIGSLSVLGAIALGARVIEKHFTDDRTRVGPDHKFSTTPEEWREMVDAANLLFTALGDGVKRIEENERDTSIVQKRGLYTTRDIKCGAVIASGDLEPLRPRSDDGFEPAEVQTLIGKTICRDITKGEMLLRKDVNI
jgi:N-acetylneuraminate synthase